MDYREKFRKDVVIDYICYRKYGHNELDDPSFTQPTMYNVIQNRKSIPEMYANQLKVTVSFCENRFHASSKNCSVPFEKERYRTLNERTFL